MASTIPVGSDVGCRRLQMHELQLRARRPVCDLFTALPRMRRPLRVGGPYRRRRHWRPVPGWQLGDRFGPRIRQSLLKACAWALPAAVCRSRDKPEARSLRRSGARPIALP